MVSGVDQSAAIAIESGRATVTGSTIWFVNHHGRDGCSLFLNGQEYDQYLIDLVSMSVAAGIKVHAFCLLRNEIQLLLGNVSRASLRRLLTRLCARHVFRQFRGDELPEFIFEPALKARRLYSDDRVLMAASEIDLLPIRKAVVARPQDYRWSSYRERAGYDAMQRKSVFRSRRARLQVTSPESAYLDLAVGPVLRARAWQDYVRAGISGLEQRVLGRVEAAELFAYTGESYNTGVAQWPVV